jgi:hypothetical protein
MKYPHKKLNAIIIPNTLFGNFPGIGLDLVAYDGRQEGHDRRAGYGLEGNLERFRVEQYNWRYLSRKLRPTIRNTISSIPSVDMRQSGPQMNHELISFFGPES